MKLFILTGPPAAGKNTIASAFAKLGKKCAVIDVDSVRQMIVQIHKAPWEGLEGQKQQLLGVKNACLLAKNFLAQKYDVLILDVLSPKTAKLYKKELRNFNPKIILLLPTYVEIVCRNKMRTAWLKPMEIKNIYQSQESLVQHDIKIDNTDKTAIDVAKYLSKIKN